MKTSHSGGSLKKNSWWISLLLSVIALCLSGWMFFGLYNVNEIQSQKLRAQALSISAWIKEDSSEDLSVVGLNNLSNSPVYDIVVTVVPIGNSGSYSGSGLSVRKAQGQENGALFTILPPGKYQSDMHAIEHGMSMRFGVEIAFRDIQNHSWILTADGHLNEIQKSPLIYYNLLGPNSFNTLETYK